MESGTVLSEGPIPALEQARGAAQLLSLSFLGSDTSSGIAIAPIFSGDSAQGLPRCNARYARVADAVTGQVGTHRCQSPRWFPRAS